MTFVKLTSTIYYNLTVDTKDCCSSHQVFCSFLREEDINWLQAYEPNTPSEKENYKTFAFSHNFSSFGSCYYVQHVFHQLTRNKLSNNSF